MKTKQKSECRERVNERMKVFNDIQTLDFLVPSFYLMGAEAAADVVVKVIKNFDNFKNFENDS